MHGHGLTSLGHSIHGHHTPTHPSPRAVPFVVRRMLRVVPLFETLDDLNHAETAMRQLFSTPWYAAHIQGKQVRGGEGG